MNTDHVPSWDELQVILNNLPQNASDASWSIYRYLNAHVPVKGKEIEDPLASVDARMMLTLLMKLPLQRPSLLFSCILSVAIKMSEVFDDFRFPAFLQLWEYPQMLRDEDKLRQTGKDGRTYLSLNEKTDRAYQSYLLHHGEERGAETSCIRTMYATKVFETEKNGRKLRSVKTVDAAGEEMLIDSHLFPCKPWEIQGHLFDVLVGNAKDGTPRAKEIVASAKKVEDIFPVLTGYVDMIDEQHGHIHVYDRYSRHMVATYQSSQRINAGDYVLFSPVIPKESKFKTAIIHRILSVEEGRETFPLRHATVTHVDTEKQYAVWTLQEGEFPLLEVTHPELPHDNSQGATTGYLRSTTLPQQGQSISIISFLRRGKDGQKRPLVVHWQITPDR